MTPQRRQYALQFRAGKLNRDPSSNMVKPDPRDGQIILDVGEEDGLMHFYWKDAKADRIEDDLLIFPEDPVFEKVPQPNSRVFVLRFRSSNEKLLFWMQEPDASGDEQICAQVNNLINSPVALEEDVSGDEDDPEAVNASDQNEMMQILQRLGDSSSTGATSSAPPNLQMPDLRNLLAGLQVPGAQGGAQQEEPMDLVDVLTPQTVGPLLNDQEVCSALFPHLPEPSQPSQGRTKREIEEVIRSPQFRQALHSLTVALRTGALGPLVQQLGLDPSAAYGVEAFLRAINRKAQTDKK